MSTSLFQNAKKNPVSTILLLLFFGYVAYSIIDDIQTMRRATTDYDYCKALCDLVEYIGKNITWCVYFAVCYLTYIHKQYSWWILWLYYLVVVVFIIYYIYAGNTTMFSITLVVNTSTVFHPWPAVYMVPHSIFLGLASSSCLNSSRTPSNLRRNKNLLYNQ